MNTRRSRAIGEVAVGLVRLLFGVICLVNALLHLDPTYRAQFMNSLAAAWSPGQPAWLAAWGHANAAMVQTLGLDVVVMAMAVVEFVLVFSLLTGFGLHWLAWVGIAYNLWLWTTVGGLGGPYTPGATDPGTAIVYALSFAMVLVTHAWRPLSTFRYGSLAAPEPWKVTLGRVLFGLMWAFDAWWKWQPAFLLHGVDNFTAAQVGQPTWIVAYLNVNLTVIHWVGPVTFGMLAASAESAIALSLLTGVRLDWMLPLGALYSFVLWTTAEGWGGPYAAGQTGNTGDVLGTANIYVVVFLFLLAARAERAWVARCGASAPTR